MGKSEKKETSKRSTVLKTISAVVLAYVAIFAVALVFAVLRLSGQKDDLDDAGWWEYVQVFLYPFLFYLAGRIVTARLGYQKMKGLNVFLGALAFSGVLLVLWYISIGASAMANMIAAQGGYAIDHSLRKKMVVVNYEYLYLHETDGYKYALLPLIYFALDMIYWLFFFLGNRRALKKER